MTPAVNSGIGKPGQNFRWLVLLTIIIAVIAGFFLLFLLGPPIAMHRHAHSFFGSVKRDVDPEELRKWAAKLAAITPTSRVTNSSELPVPLRDSEFENGWIREASQNDSWCMTLIYGGGFFHYGIEIGPTNFLDSSSPQFTVIQWVPGIYFRHEGKD
jgi:hypothetical protein